MCILTLTAILDSLGHAPTRSISGGGGGGGQLGHIALRTRFSGSAVKIALQAMDAAGTWAEHTRRTR